MTGKKSFHSKGSVDVLQVEVTFQNRYNIITWNKLDNIMFQARESVESHMQKHPQIGNYTKSKIKFGLGF